MGLRFRKSIKVAPGVKINLNKNSVSATVGTKGAHYTVNSKGKKTSTVGIPGTGLSYTSSSGGGKKKSPTNNEAPTNVANQSLESGNRKKKKHGCLTFIIVLFILSGIGSVISGEDKLEDVTISSDVTNDCNINTDINITAKTEPNDFELSSEDFKTSGGEISVDGNNAIFKTSEAGKYDIWIENGDIKSNVLTINVIDKAAIEAQKEAEEAQRKAEEEAAALAAEQKEAEAKAQEEKQAQQPQEEMVWIPNSGSKYHSKSSCSGMNNPQEVTLSKAKSMGYTPCKRCH